MRLRGAHRLVANEDAILTAKDVKSVVASAGLASRVFAEQAADLTSSI
jgi:hypothetical protein